jgi:catechol 2,3-dioxygenase-like lactoylglutathione lyase family enzyme
MGDEQAQAHLGNVAFWVSDFAAMRAFYSGVLGVPELHAGDRPRNWVFYGNQHFSFSLNEAPYAPAPRGWARCPMDPKKGEAWDAYFTIYVPDLDAVIARCRAGGHALHTDAPFSLGEGFGRSIEVRDPDGNTVAVTQR